MTKEFDDLGTTAAKFITDVDADIALVQSKAADAKTKQDALQATIDSLTAGDVITAAQLAQLQADAAANATAATALNTALSAADQRVTDLGTQLGVPLPPVVPPPTA